MCVSVIASELEWTLPHSIMYYSRRNLSLSPLLLLLLLLLLVAEEEMRRLLLICWFLLHLLFQTVVGYNNSHTLTPNSTGLLLGEPEEEDLLSPHLEEHRWTTF